MCSLEVIFWICVFIVFYTYLGYGILLYLLVKTKELFISPKHLTLPDNLPEVTLLIAAYNEEDIVKEKMSNTLALRYPASLLNIVWVTDGSTDNTNALLKEYPQVNIIFDPQRGGKAAAFNHAMPLIKTPLVVYTDANTMLCEDAIREIVIEFTDTKVGCVAGEKRVSRKEQQNAAASEGLYWHYESTLKALDYRLYSAVGAAGELFAIRTNLYMEFPKDTLLDDFMLSMKIAQRGYKIAYCSKAYATESASADIKQEAKRKIRIAAGGIQPIIRLRGLLNIFRYGTLSFQYISHRVLRWSITPFLWFSILPLNIILSIYGEPSWLYLSILILQLIFYALGICGYMINDKEIKNKFIFIPYYFLFMNVCVLQGISYLRKNKGIGTWEKAKRG
ncbi:MAG: glycosyltransferase family 2 protein [Rikenellaceae bacterium]